MSNIIEFLKSQEAKQKLMTVYNLDEQQVETQVKRYQDLAEKFSEKHSLDNAGFFSSPGRIEIIGNHTDHQLGRIVAASTDMDTIAIVTPNSDGKIYVKSLEYDEFTIDANDFEAKADDSRTVKLIKGMLECLHNNGRKIGGFNAYMTTTVLSAAGVSSSASFEMLIGAIINHLYNNGEISTLEIAKAGQWSENNKWDKKSGLLDQLACATGGMITIDFADYANPAVEKLDSKVIQDKYDFFITPTGEDHAGLDGEYTAITVEMKAISNFFGKEYLKDVSLEDVLHNLPELREKAGDRAVLRALHFIGETERVRKLAGEVKQHDYSNFEKAITDSGLSSWRFLQNCATPDSKHQGIALFLTMNEIFFANHSGVCRVHGGGFAGAILSVIPKEESPAFKQFIKEVLHNDFYEAHMRDAGSIKVF